MLSSAGAGVVDQDVKSTVENALLPVVLYNYLT